MKNKKDLDIDRVNDEYQGLAIHSMDNATGLLISRVTAALLTSYSP